MNATKRAARARAKRKAAQRIAHQRDRMNAKHVFKEGVDLGRKREFERSDA